MRKIYYLLTLMVMVMANMAVFAEGPMYITFTNPDHIKEVKYNNESIPVSANIAVETNWMKALRLVITPADGCTIDSWNLDKAGQDPKPGKITKGSLQISVPSEYGNGTLTVYTSKEGEEKIMRHVTFDMNDGAYDAITAVRANGTTINSWDWGLPEGFEVEDNTNMEIEFNTKDYHIDLFQIDGEDTANYKFTVTADMTVTIEAHRYGMYNVSVNGDTRYFTLYHGEYNPYTGTFNRKPIDMDGFTCLVDEKSPYLYIERAPGFTITSVVDENGDNVPVEEYFKVHKNMKLTITGDELVYDQNLVVFLYNADLAEAPEILTNDGKSFPLTEGYQTLKFAAEDNIVSLKIKNADGKEKINSAYLNDESLPGNDFRWNFNYMTVKNNDVLLAFVGGEPAKHPISVGGIGEAPFAVIRHNVAETEDPSAFEMYAGTVFSVVPTTDQQIKVKFGNATEEAALLTRAEEEELTPDENGAYHFTVNGPISLVVEDAVPTSVSEIEVSGNAPVAIYNLQGIRVSGDAQNLPAGIYVIDGKKVQIRK